MPQDDVYKKNKRGSEQAQRQNIPTHKSWWMLGEVRNMDGIQVQEYRLHPQVEKMSSL